MQLSETWRTHKEQLRLQQQEKEARAASPTPPARLSSEARQRYRYSPVQSVTLCCSLPYFNVLSECVTVLDVAPVSVLGEVYSTSFLAHILL